MVIGLGVDTLLSSNITGTPLFRFLLVGAAAFCLDAATMWVLTQLGIGPYVARIGSLCLSMVFTFFLNRRATFAAQGQPNLQEFGVYVGASLIGIIINYGVYVGCLKLGMVWIVAMGLGTAIASAFNFFAYGRIFKRS